MCIIVFGEVSVLPHSAAERVIRHLDARSRIACRVEPATGRGLWKAAKAAKNAKATRGRRAGSGERASRSNANPTSRFPLTTRDAPRLLALPTSRLPDSHRRCPMPDYGHDLQFGF